MFYRADTSQTNGHSVVSRYLYYPKTLADHSRHVGFCLFSETLTDPPEGWRHDHGLPIGECHGKKCKGEWKNITLSCKVNLSFLNLYNRLGLELEW